MEYKRTGTLKVHGSGGSVMAPLASFIQFYEGRWVHVRITQVLRDEDIPLPVREALVDVIVETIFTKSQMLKASERFEELIPNGARLTYANEVARALADAGKSDAAEIFVSAMEERFPREDWKLVMLIFEEGEYEIPTP